MPKKIATTLWMLVAAAALGFLIWRTDREMFRTAISELNWPLAVGALAVYTISQALLAVRWVQLLRVHGVIIPLAKAVQLTFLGLFYNNVMPGAVGGDLLKGWYVSRHSQKGLRLEAAVTVLLDRIIGLAGMVLVGSLASLFLNTEGAAKTIGLLRYLIWGILGAMVIGCIVVFSQRIRSALKLNALLNRLPFADKLRKADSAVRTYRNHLPTVAIALALTATIQGLAVVAVWILTKALHFESVTFIQCLIIMPMIWVISAAVPVPGGLGVIETCVTYLFCLVINPQAPDTAQGAAAALALLIRALIVVSSLPGAIIPLIGGHMPNAKQMAAEIEKDNADNEENRSHQAE